MREVLYHRTHCPSEYAYTLILYLKADLINNRAGRATQLERRRRNDTSQDNMQCQGKSRNAGVGKSVSFPNPEALESIRDVGIQCLVL